MAKSIFQTFLDIEIFLLYFLGDNAEKAEVSGSFKHRVIKLKRRNRSYFSMSTPDSDRINL